MTRIVMLYCAFAACVVVLLSGAVVVRRLVDGRRHRRDALLSRQYLHIVILSLMSETDTVPHFPRLESAGARMVLAETLARLVSSTYGLDLGPLRRIFRDAGLQPYLLRCARRTRGFRRARCLSLLSRLPADAAVAAAVERYGSDRHRAVRFYALMVRLAADPSMALQLIGAYPDPLSAFELSEIVSMLRRGVLPVAYEPLIESPNRNLRSLGIAIVRQFGIEEAEENLLRIASEDTTGELGREALYALCALRRPMARREVVRRMGLMSRAERRALLRCMALEGYSETAFGSPVGDEETPYFESFVLSYKRCLVC